MARALALAERGRGRTSPNPMVGAVIVDAEGVVVGRGAHERAGGPHAEVRRAGRCRRSGSRRDTLLHARALLAHRTDRTVRSARRRSRGSPCRDRRSRIRTRWWLAAASATSGTRGVDVIVGVMRDEAERLNRPFFTFISRQRPFVTMKAAVSLDGMVAARKGARTSITGAEANEPDARGTRRDRRHCDWVRDRHRRRPAADGARRLSGPAVDAGDLRPAAAHACAGADLLDARRWSGRDRDGDRRRSVPGG